MRWSTIPDPIKAVEEIWRVLRPGGVFYASFDPVWAADSGSHFIHYTHEPWLHLLVDDDEYCALMKSAGADDWELSEYRCAMNRLPAYYYNNELKSVISNIFARFQLDHWSGSISGDNYDHPNKSKASKLNGLDPDDLLIRGFEISSVK